MPDGAEGLRAEARRRRSGALRTLGETVAPLFQGPERTAFRRRREEEDLPLSSQEKAVWKPVLLRGLQLGSRKRTAKGQPEIPVLTQERAVDAILAEATRNDAATWERLIERLGGFEQLEIKRKEAEARLIGARRVAAGRSVKDIQREIERTEANVRARNRAAGIEDQPPILDSAQSIAEWSASHPGVLVGVDRLRESLARAPNQAGQIVSDLLAPENVSARDELRRLDPFVERYLLGLAELLKEGEREPGVPVGDIPFVPGFAEDLLTRFIGGRGQPTLDVPQSQLRPETAPGAPAPVAAPPGPAPIRPGEMPPLPPR